MYLYTIQRNCNCNISGQREREKDVAERLISAPMFLHTCRGNDAYSFFLFRVIVEPWPVTLKSFQSI